MYGENIMKKDSVKRHSFGKTERLSGFTAGILFLFSVILFPVLTSAQTAVRSPSRSEPVVPKIWNLPAQEAPAEKTPIQAPVPTQTRTPVPARIQTSAPASSQNFEIEIVEDTPSADTADAADTADTETHSAEAVTSGGNFTSNSGAGTGASVKTAVKTDVKTDAESESASKSENNAENEEKNEEKNEAAAEVQPFSPSSWLSPGGISQSVLMVVILSAVSLAPAFVMMTTSFVRIFVVFGILRHGFGTQGIPGTQILAALALFMTLFIMYPTWERVYSDALIPYQNGEISAEDAWKHGLKPLRDFMGEQLEHTGNTDEILLFWRYSPEPPTEEMLASCTMEDVPTHVLLPAFMLSELKTAFLIGVQLLLPMLVIDLLVSAVLVSMGMYMLPPTLVSLPFKLLLFVLVDGWRLVVEMLLVGFIGK